MTDYPHPNIGLQDVRDAQTRIDPYIHHTPVITSRTLDDRFGTHFFFKAENLQETGSFKFRGACNAIFSLTEADAEKGVVTHSSGNFAQALALAAKMRNIPASIVMPETASPTKRDAVIAYGAQITLCEPTNAARQETADKIAQDTGAHFIHPSNDLPIIAGQGTAALELLEEIPDIDLILVPVGGGGLSAGAAIATQGLSPSTNVIGVEPAGADDAYRSLQQGKLLPSLNPNTIADGLLTALGTNTFPILQHHLQEIITVEDEAIIEALRLLWKRLKLLIEPSAATAFAPLIEKSLDPKDQRIGIILSGGNVNLDKLPW